MTRQEQQDRDRRYADWERVYVEEVRERVKHWGDRRKRSASRGPARVDNLDGALFAPGGDDV